MGSGSGQERGLLLTWRVGSVGTGTRESGAALQSSGATTCDKSGGKCLQLNLERSKMEKSGGHLELRCTHVNDMYLRYVMKEIKNAIDLPHRCTCVSSLHCVDQPFAAETKMR